MNRYDSMIVCVVKRSQILKKEETIVYIPFVLKYFQTKEEV